VKRKKNPSSTRGGGNHASIPSSEEGEVFSKRKERREGRGAYPRENLPSSGERAAFSWRVSSKKELLLPQGVLSFRFSVSRKKGAFP